MSSFVLINPTIDGPFRAHPTALMDGPPVEHPQTAVYFPSGWTNVDAGLACFMTEFNHKLPWHVRTDFSCQGNSGERNSAYLTLATPTASWMDEFFTQLIESLRTLYPNPVETTDLGEWGVTRKHVKLRKVSKHVYVERDYINAAKFSNSEKWLRMLYPESTSRLHIRWTPDEFPIVTRAVFNALEVTCQASQ